MVQTLRIANTCAFWGDDIGASARTIALDPTIDFLTLDYLAEVSMSILAKLKQRNPEAGYASDFIEVITSLISAWKSGGKFKIVTNAGGLNPRGSAHACARILRNAGLTQMKIAIVTGDDVLPILQQSPSIDPGILSRMTTANAYLGAAPIAEAIRQGADIVITGRVADPSLTVGPCLAHFGWDESQLDAIAGATVAGHLIECGTQVTGGISTDWLDLYDHFIGFPIVEISPDGSCVVTKPSNSGGKVDGQTVKEQLLYELGDPSRYLSPDVTASFLTLRVEESAKDRVRVSGATGNAPPDKYKVSATLRAGYRASATLTIAGHNAVAKARRCGENIHDYLLTATGMREPQKFHIECLGSGDVAPGVLPRRDDLMETVLRVTVYDHDRELVELFSRLIVPMVTAGPQGTTGYFESRPQVREVFEYWPTLIDRSSIEPVVEMMSL